MKRTLLILLLGGALALSVGCDELEEVTIDLGGVGSALGYLTPSTYYDPGYRSDYYRDDYYIEEEYIEEEVIVEEYYMEDELWYDDWGLWW